MGREILFRGKRLDSGEWVEGHFFQIWERTYILWGTTNGIPNMVEVAPTTVGQYTGLTDKNGKKIFEGDILRCSWKGTRYTPVNFRDGMFKAHGMSLITWTHPDQASEVIGNIHDNPELIGGGSGWLSGSV